MMIFFNYKLLLILLIFSTCFTSFGFSQEKVSLIYEEKKGIFSITFDGKPIIKDAHSYAVLTNHTIVSSNKSKNSITKTIKPFDNYLGKGNRISYTSTGTKNVKLIQHFTVYENTPVVLMELEVVGTNLSSNELVPIYSKQTTSWDDKNWHQVIVPFDNDEFISYENNPLQKDLHMSAEVGLLLDKNSNEGLIMASLDQSIWKSGVFFSGSQHQISELKVLAGATNKRLTHDDMPHGAISGNSIKSPTYYLSYAKNWRLGMEQYAKLHKNLNKPYVKPWTKATPMGWNSWGEIQKALTFQNATSNVDFFRNNLPKFRNEDHVAYIDLDSGWDNFVKDRKKGDYSKLKLFVEYCKMQGLKPGIYLSPFTDWGHKGGPDRIVQGTENVRYGDIWTITKTGYHDIDGGRSIDPTHPATLARLKYDIEKMKACGFEMIKIDFLSHAAIEAVKFYDPTITTGMQAYHYGMRKLVDYMGDDILIYAAISPSIATSPYVHTRRIACDAWNTIQHSEYTLNSVSYGWWQTYLYDHIDADHLVFTNETLEVNKARLLSGVICGPLILGDDFSRKQNIDPKLYTFLQDKEILEIVKDGKSFRPIGFATEKSANNIYVKFIDTYCYIAVLNFNKGTNSIQLDFDQLGLDLTKKYSAIELFDKIDFDLQHNERIRFNTAGAKLYRINLN